MKFPTLFDMTGRVSCVTGAASGLGLAIAEVLAAAGSHVMMVDLDAAALETESARLRTEGLSVDAIVLDVAQLDGFEAALDDVVARYGRLDAVFANAGISAGPGFALSETGRIEHLQREKWEQVLTINLTAATWAIKAAAKHMCAQGSGRIVVTASIGGIRAEPFVGYAQCGPTSGDRTGSAQRAGECHCARTVPDEHRRRAVASGT